VSQPAVGRRDPWQAVLAGAGIGALGGLVGLGGAEFRLPVLIGLFGFAVLSAVIVNKAMSLVVVVVAIPARLLAVPAAEVIGSWTVVANLLLGSLVGAWLGAGWAARMRTVTLSRVLAGLLLGIAVVFGASHLGWFPQPAISGVSLLALGVLAGFGIGVVAAVMGVAGGELLIPTITVLYALDVKLAGSLSLLVSLPTMAVAFLRYSRDQAFVVLRQERGFIAWLAFGSILGTVVGGLALGSVPSGVIVPIVVVLLLASAWKLWQHARPSSKR